MANEKITAKKVVEIYASVFVGDFQYRVYKNGVVEVLSCDNFGGEWAFRPLEEDEDEFKKVQEIGLNCLSEDELENQEDAIEQFKKALKAVNNTPEILKEYMSYFNKVI